MKNSKETDATIKEREAEMARAAACYAMGRKLIVFNGFCTA
jgi:hypothetical protein